MPSSPVLIVAALAALGSTAPVGLPSTSLSASAPVALPSPLISAYPVPIVTSLRAKVPAAIPSPLISAYPVPIVTSLRARVPAAIPSPLISAYPVPIVNSLRAKVPAALPSQLFSASLPSMNGRTPSGESEGEFATDPNHSEASDVRAAASSIAVTFDTISTETQPYTEQLTYLTPSNATITEITNIVYSIKAPIVAAIPQLEALAGQEASIILASVGAVAGDAELTVAQIAGIAGGYVDFVLAAAGHVLDVTSTEGGDVVADVKGVLTDLGDALTGLIGATTPLVNGIPAFLTPVVVPVESVISDLNLIELAIILDLSI